MIPILYDTNETTFATNGLGRLRDCISCIVTEERNGIYECDFEYPVTGANYAAIQLGRIIGVTHDDTGDVQPFDIVSYTRPIDGVVKFHAVHISYRQSYLTVAGSNISGINNAFALLAQAQPSNPFSYESDITSNAYVAAADGEPRTVRSMLGGVEGSILDAFGGEYEFDRFKVTLYKSRGVVRDFTIRYGVNMLDYNDDTSSAGTYSAVIPFYKGTDNAFIIGDRQSSGETVTGRGETIPLDVSDKFEDEPTKAEVEAMGLSILEDSESNLPTQTINVSFVRLQDMGEYTGLSALLKCKLCDSIKVIFPRYNTSGTFKIVKTTWDVLMGRYESMELGTLSTTLSEALGLSNGRDSYGSSGGGGEGVDFIVEEGDSGIWHYRKWNAGKIEAWAPYSFGSASWSTWSSPIRYMDKSITIPNGIFSDTPSMMATSISNQYWVVHCAASSATAAAMRLASLTSTSMATYANIYAWTD